MTVEVSNIIPPKQAENVSTDQYTSVGITIIDKFTATNTTGGPVTIDVNLIESGGSVGDSNLIVSSHSLAANTNYTFPAIVGHTLQNGDIISTNASAASSLTIRASGRVITTTAIT